MEASRKVEDFAEKNAVRVGTLGLAIVALAALCAALSGQFYQAGVMGLQQAFSVLQISGTWGLGLGVLACLGGVTLSVIAYKRDFITNAPTGSIGVIIAIAVFFVPYSQFSRGAPPIHEVTTDFENPPAFIDIVPLRVASKAANPPEFVPVIKGFGLEVDVVAEQKEHYPDIQPLRFNGTNYDAVFEKAMDGVNKMGWTLVSSSPTLGRIEAYDTTAWFGFVDDIVIRIEAQPMAYELDIRSKSRVGFGDVGANAKRVRDYLKATSGRSSH